MGAPSHRKTQAKAVHKSTLARALVRYCMANKMAILHRIITLLLVSLALVLAMTTDNVLPVTGTTAEKKKPKKVHEIANHTQNLSAGVDLSAVVYKSLKRQGSEPADELGYALHSHGQFVVPESSKRALQSGVISVVEFARKIGSEPIMYMDGRPLGAKEDEVQKRMGEKKESFDRAVQKKEEARRKEVQALVVLEADGIDAEAEALALRNESKKLLAEAAGLMRASIYRHQKINAYVAAICHDLNVTLVVAPYEADSMIAHAFYKGDIGYALCEDGDMIMYWVDTLFGGIEQYYDKKAGGYKVAWFSAAECFKDVITYGSKQYDFRKWEKWQFQIFGNLCGTDYTRNSDAVKGAGLKHSYDVVIRMIDYMEKDSQLSISDALKASLSRCTPLAGKIDAAHDAVMLGMAAFNGQFVYSYKDRIQQRLNPDWPLTESQQMFLGEPIPEVCVMQGLICGNGANMHMY